MLRHRTRSILYTIAAVALFWMLINLVIAALHADHPRTERFYSDVFSILNDILPHAEVPFANAGGGPERVNNLGFRGPDTTWEKPPGMRRLVSLGDSSTFGVFVKDNETYTALVGKALAENDRWETINGGIPGTCILQTRLMYEYKASRLQPDVTMVYVIPNVRADLDALREMNDRHGVWRAEKNTAVQRFLQVWPLYRMMRNLMKGPRAAGIRNQVEMIYTEQRSISETQRFLRGYREDLRKLRELIVESGARPVWICHITRNWVEEHAAKGTTDEDLMRDPLSGQPENFYTELKDFAEREGDLFVNPYPLAVAAARRGTAVFVDVVHPTKEGHAIIARAILDKLEPVLTPTHRF